MTEIVFDLTDGEAKDVLAFVDRVAPSGDGIGEFSVLYKLIQQYEEQAPSDNFTFVLTTAEADDVIAAFRHMVPNQDGYPTVYYKLVTQDVPVPVHVITEDYDRIVTEDGNFYIVTNN